MSSEVHPATPRSPFTLVFVVFAGGTGPTGFLPWSPGTISESCSTVSSSSQPQGLYAPWNSPGQNTGVGSLSLLQGVFPTQGSNPGLPHCRWILYQLSYEGNPRILEWVAYPFSRWSFWPRNWTGVSCIAEGFFTNWAIREALAQLASKLFLISGNCVVHRDEMLWHSFVLFLYFASSSHLFPLLELFAKLQIP